MKRRERKIKILYTIPNFNTAGSGKALLNVISRIDKNIFEPAICCRHEKGELFKTAEEMNVPIYISYFTALMKPRLKGIKNILRLSRLFKKINPDIIHSYNYSDDYSEGLASRLSGIKWVYTKKNMGWGSNAWKIRSKIADAIIPQNEEMVNRFFPGSGKLVLIPIGIDIDEFAGLKRDTKIIDEFKLRDSFPVILTIANVIPIKGIDYLIRGFSLVLEDYGNAKLLIVGEDRTEYADSLKKKVSEEGLDGKVIFTGKRNEIKPFFSVADIFVLSSTKTGEGGPISILEAMASGIVSFGSDVPGIRDQFRELPDQLFESENPGAIANKIINFVQTDDETKQKMIKKQLEFIRKHYSVENEVLRLQELYLNLLGRHVT
ncbi:MAG: glycosyltransferase [Bacteroidetes bacterium]|nr:glycosyltransferase [Bacteroidota bacterium]